MQHTDLFVIKIKKWDYLKHKIKLFKPLFETENAKKRTKTFDEKRKALFNKS